MRPSTVSVFVLGALLAFLVSSEAPAQWSMGVSPIAGVDYTVDCLVVYDDGSGPSVYAGGEFTVAGGVAAKGVARWTGSAWVQIGPALAGTVRALAVYDDGGGPKLYAGGVFTAAGNPTTWYLARWNGSTWSQVGTGGPSATVVSLGVFDDGSGSKLYAGGSFNPANGGTPLKYVGRWDGTSWSNVGNGLNGSVSAFRMFDDGTGMALYVGGGFTGFYLPSGQLSPASCVAKWNGTGWSAVGAGFTGAPTFPLQVQCFEVFDDGAGPRLYAGGQFDHSGAVAVSRVAKWDGMSWQPLGSGVTSASPAANPAVNALRSIDVDGPGGAPPVLLAGGVFDHAGGLAINDLCGWNGTAWHPYAAQGSDGFVQALTSVATPAGDVVFVGGYFTSFDGILVRNIVQRFGATWSAVGNGLAMDPNLLTAANAAVVLNDGTGPAVFAGGHLPWGGQPYTNRLVKWDGTTLTPVGPVFAGDIRYLGVLDDGSGPQVYVAGDFGAIDGAPAGGIARWNGATFAPMGTFPGTVRDMVVFDDGAGPALYAGGQSAISTLVRWNGASWAPVAGAPAGAVQALAVFDPDGPGPGAPRLYTGGAFVGVGSSNVMAYTGAGWIAGTSFTSSFGPNVSDLLVFDDGSGPALYVGGLFESAGGLAANGIARWNGVSWSAVGTGAGFYHQQLAVQVTALGLFDDGGGGGTQLYAGGTFTHGNGFNWNTQPMRNVARFDGTDWRPIGVGVEGTPRVLVACDHGSGPRLFVGGSLTSTGGFGSGALGEWRGPCPVFYISQPGNAGAPVTIEHRNLVPGHEYYTLFSTNSCFGSLGRGPYAGLCAYNALPFLIAQFNLPVGTPPIHFVATSPTQSFGPFTMPSMSLEAVSFDWTGGVLGPGSTVVHVTIN